MLAEYMQHSILVKSMCGFNFLFSFLEEIKAALKLLKWSMKPFLLYQLCQHKSTQNQNYSEVVFLVSIWTTGHFYPIQLTRILECSSISPNGW